MKKKNIGPDKEVHSAKEPKVASRWSKMTKKKRILTVVISVVTLLAVAAAIVLPIVLLSDGDDKNFEYTTADLTKYVDFSAGSYKDYTLDIDIALPKDIDPDVAMLNMLARDASTEPEFDGAYKKTEPVTPGDVVHIWYRGYLLDENGEELSVSGMCNYGNSSPTALTIGSGSFVPGFELNLLGKMPHGYTNFKITSGEVKETQIAYVSYSLYTEGEDEDDAKKSTTVRVDMSSDEVDEKMGEGFKERLLGRTIGEELAFDTVKNGKTQHYINFKVDFVTEKEPNAYVVECYFPYDYSSSSLANQTAYFEVIIVQTQIYDTPDYTYEQDADGKYRFNLTNEYIEQKLAEDDSPITLEELMEYEGEELWQKYRAYAEAYLMDAYEENRRALIEEEMWTYYLKYAKILKYPQNKVDAVYREYYDDVLYQYEYTGGSISLGYDSDYDGIDDTEYYDNIDDFAEAYLGLYYSETEWKDYLRSLSESLVAERLILYYIMQQENLTPTEEEFEQRLAALKQEYIDEYLLQYAEEFEVDTSKYTEEEYEEYVAKRTEEIFDYYDESYFRETTYYEIALETLITYPTVTTMDDRESSLPQTK